MKKVYVFTGGYGSGKTTAAVTIAPPNEIDKLLYIDTEDSASDLAGLGFEHIRMYDRLQLGGDMLERLDRGDVPWVDESQRSALVGYYEYLISVLNEKLIGKKYVAIDTVGPIEAAMTAAVESGRRVFGWSGVRAYGKMEVEGVRPLYEGLLEAIAQRGVEKIALTSHIKPVWIDDKPVIGKVKPGGRQKVLSRLSSAMFWLVPGSCPSGAPAALVLKARIGKIGIVDGKWNIQRVLPERMPVFSWDKIEEYKNNPADLANPKPGEKMNEQERQMISELLTDEQMRLMILSAEQKANGHEGLLVKKSKPVDVLAEKEERGLVSDKQVKELIESGHSNSEIAKQTGLTLPQVIKIRRELG